MGKSLRVLIVEDSEDDAQLLVTELRRGGYEPIFRRVETEADMRAALDNDPWDAVLADHQMPHFSSVEALACLQSSGQDLPFIIVSGVLDEATAVNALRAGAHDFMVKGNLARLMPALDREIREAGLRRTRREVEAALRAAQAQYKLWVEQIPVVTYEATEAGFTYISPQIEDLLGYTPAEWLAAPDMWAACLHAEDRQWVLDARTQARATRKTFLAEYRLVAKEGWDVWVLDQASPKPNAGQGLKVLGVLLDITSRKRAEAALQQKELEVRVMTEQLLQAARLATMGELAGTIAHQLNNPLAIISLRIEQLLARMPVESSEGRSLAAVEDAADRMRVLVANLLQYSQRSVRRVSTLDVCQEVGRTLEFVQYQMRLRGIVASLDCAEDVPLIRGDRQSLRQVFLNLFTNAGEAMSRGGVLSVRVKTAQLNDGVAVSVEVTDTGIGIAAEDLPRVWETFYTTKPEGYGTGLGLAICRRIVQEHSGTIEISSELSRGTTVVVLLPVTPGADVIAPSEQ